MPASTTNSQVLSIIQLMGRISNTLMNGLHVVDMQMMSGTTSVPSMRIFVGMLFVPQLSSSTHFMPQNKVRSSNMILTYCNSMCGGTDAGGSVELCSMQSPICNASEYVEELQRCIGDASEKHGVQYTGSYSDTIPPSHIH